MNEHRKLTYIKMRLNHVFSRTVTAPAGLAALMLVVQAPLTAQETSKDAGNGGPVTVSAVQPLTAPAPAGETPKAEVKSQPASDTSKPASPQPLHSILSFNGDIYLGGTNVTGVRARNNDGIWAGFGTAYPSTLSLNWKEGEARSFHVSVGVGDMYTGRGTTWRQPVEGYYQFSAGAGSLTLGKYYVPFAAQEWEFEPKYGAMFTGGHGASTFVASLNYNTNVNTPNFYARAGRQVTKQTSLGVSAGMGKGLFTDTSHNGALGIDITHTMRAVQFTSEYDLAIGPHGTFQFIYGKFTFTRMGNFAPYFGAYYWHDNAHELGAYNSLVAGASYRLTRNLALEGGYARGVNRDVFWLQSHTTF